MIGHHILPVSYLLYILNKMIVLIYILLLTPLISCQEDDGFELVEEPHFSLQCPGNYFMCKNGECISPKWRCDGHYDCDDYSDELNCTHHFENLKKHSLPVEEPTKLEFNSTIEPLMLFSNGLSIRGFWMRSRIYFDVVSLMSRQAMIETTSISQAFSILFGLATPSGSSSSSPTKLDEINVKMKSTIVGIDMDPHNKEVFWVELGKEPGVYSTLISEDEFEDSRARRQLNDQKTIVDTGLISPEDIALDNIGRNIYITDAGQPAIIVCSIKHRYCKHLVEHGIQKPRAIIVDPSTGWLTYTDWGDDPGIFVVSMNGKRKEALVKEDIVWPNGLAADYTNDQLYWADARLKKIERIDLKTKVRNVVIREAAGNPFSLSLFENRIYWSDWSGSDIKTCDKITGNTTKTVLHSDNIYGIHIFHPSIYGNSEQTDPCWSLHCTHLCLIGPASPHFSERKRGIVSSACIIPLQASKKEPMNSNNNHDNSSNNSSHNNSHGDISSHGDSTSHFEDTNHDDSNSHSHSHSHGHDKDKDTHSKSDSNVIASGKSEIKSESKSESQSQIRSLSQSSHIVDSTGNTHLLWVIILLVVLSLCGFVAISLFFYNKGRVPLDRVQLIN